MAAEEEFVEFAGAVSSRLQGVAFLLCGDWHTAEDLVQAMLVKVFVSWRRIGRQETAHAYAARTLVNTYLAHKRLRRTGEIPTGGLPERAAGLPAPETRMVVLAALATLPPKGRAAVVLRYWADLSVDQVAAVLGCSPGAVKSQSARALDKLRGVPGLSELSVTVDAPGKHLLAYSDAHRVTAVNLTTGHQASITAAHIPYLDAAYNTAAW